MKHTERTCYLLLILVLLGLLHRQAYGAEVELKNTPEGLLTLMEVDVELGEGEKWDSLVVYVQGVRYSGLWGWWAKGSAVRMACKEAGDPFCTTIQWNFWNGQNEGVRVFYYFRRENEVRFSGTALRMRVRGVPRLGTARVFHQGREVARSKVGRSETWGSVKRLYK